MNKRNKILALSSSALMLLSLVSCDVTATPKENVLIEFGDGKVVVTADEVFNKYLETKEGVEAVYEQINDAVARWTMYTDSANASKKEELISEAEAEVDDVKAEAENNAKTNKTNYDDELETLLKNNGADDLEELQVIFENKKFRSYLTDKFYDDFLEDLKEGGEIKINDTDSIQVDSYINDVLPYHVKHILVKVSAGEANYTTSTISETESVELYQAINSLGYDTETSFGIKANNISDDTGSAADYGDLGIMSINTSYVNEFKLGIYAYDTLFNNDVNKSGSTLDKVNNFLLNDDEATKDYKEYLTNHGLNFIPSGVAELLYNNRKVTLDKNNEKVNDGKEQYYPRNILWNEYLNKHEVSFIEYGKASFKDTAIAGKDADFLRNNNEFINIDVPTNPTVDADGFVLDGSKTTNYKAFEFKKYNADGTENGTEKHYILTDGNRANPKPVLVTRAGTGSGESGYQGIHFIVVERSALQDTVNDITLDEYYTTKLPDINGKIEGLGDKRVYVNAFDDTQKAYQSRIDTLISEIKDADNSIDKKINRYYFLKSGAKVLDENLNNDLNILYDAGQVSDDEEAKSELVSKWQEYVRMLERQNNERKSEKLLPLVCAINFDKASELDGDGELFGLGGVCHYVEQKA